MKTLAAIVVAALLPAVLPAQNTTHDHQGHTHPAPPAAPAAVPAPIPGGGTPKASCPDATWKFGAAPQATTMKHEFIIKNEGDGLLTIVNVIPTCACSAAVPKKKDVPPGESTAIETVLNTQNLQGPLTKNITVVTNDPKQPNLLLTLTGEILPPYVVRPKELVVGRLPKNTDSATQEVTLTITRGADVQVKNIKTSTPLLEVSPLGGPVEQADGSRLLKFSAVLRKGMNVGLARETVSFMTDSPGMPVTVVQVQAQIDGEVALDPRTFNLGRVKRGESAEKILNLTKSGAADLVVEGVSVAPEAPFAAEVIPVEQGKSYQIKVSLKSDAPDGYHRGTLTIRTNCPGETTIQAFFYAYMGR